MIAPTLLVGLGTWRNRIKDRMPCISDGYGRAAEKDRICSF